MKKLTSLLLALFVLFTFGTSAATAQNAPAFVVSEETAQRGGTVDITISLKRNPGITSIKLAVTFDADLVLTGVTYNSALGGQSMQPQDFDSPVTLNWFNGLADTYGDLVYATLTFTVSGTAAEGDHAITLSFDADDVFNLAEDNVSFAVENGKVTVAASQSILYGDVDDDGVIGIGDVTMLAKALAGWDLGDEYHPENADCDGDGVIGIGDITQLAKALAGWIVPLGPVD